MEKENNHEDVKLESERNEETLEISPTGYGFMYVTESEEEQKIDQKK